MWISITGVLLIIMIVLAAVLGARSNDSSQGNPFGNIQSASCSLQPLTESYSGTLTLSMIESNGQRMLQVTGTISGLGANSVHGMHVHQYGQVIPNSSGSALGGHYNPDNVNHGCPDNPRHSGDFGNIQAAADGTATISLTTTLFTLSEDHPVLGRSIVIHAGQDDCVTNPAGDSGPRGAACTIGIRNP